MSNKKSLYNLAYQKCVQRGLIKSNCDNFLKLDFEIKMKKCKTSKCKKFYKNKLRSLKKSKRKSSSKKRKSSPKKRKSSSKKRKSSRKSDGFVVDFPVKPYNTCYVWKGF